MTKHISIRKASGEAVTFAPEKLNKSLQRSGASPEQIETISESISQRLYEGISTKKIYRMAFAMLRNQSRHLAARYHLKNAIMELGPSGFPFEKFVGELVRYQGYVVKVGELMRGRCVTHEIDVLAENHKDIRIIECKYHNKLGLFSDIKIPLYIHSRFKDVESERLQDHKFQSKIHQCWVVTNTRFSTDAIQYGRCAGLHLVGWDYPAKGSLKDQIDTQGLYPITCLTTLTVAEKKTLLDRKVVLCIEVMKCKQLLDCLNLKPQRLKTVLCEVNDLCKFLNTK